MERLPSKNDSERLNLRGRFPIPKLSITEKEMHPIGHLDPLLI